MVTGFAATTVPVGAPPLAAHVVAGGSVAVSETAWYGHVSTHPGVGTGWPPEKHVLSPEPPPP